MNWLWAIGAILVIATIYEFSPKAGVALTVLALMGMIAAYYRKVGGVS